ncbi:MAG: LPS export ABC transporter periplasmic protein LptC [Pyrinomonadaceae bacterium MAG19_C2-C3]|nr:LPS export ABC transporter periplasmic protein LptC [Pyrinomonadaceae bacterium MAG19_C2-C3]
MEHIKSRRVFGIGLRARLPLVVRVLAIAALIAGVIGVIIAYRSVVVEQPFVLRSGQPELSKEVQAIVEGYERSVSGSDGKLKLVLRAARDVTYTDGHHELESVHLESYPETGDVPDVIDARRAIYDNEKGEVSFAGDVRVETRDRMKVRTEAAVYNQHTETAHATVPVEFERENVRGRADAATLFAKGKKLELRGAVEIIVAPEALTGGQAIRANNSRSQPVTLRADAADFEHANLFLAFRGNASAEQESELLSGDVMRTKLDSDRHVRHIEVRGKSYLRTLTEGRAAEVTAADMDFYFTPEQRFERAVAKRSEAQGVDARSLNSDSEMNLRSASQIEINFDTQGEQSLLKEMRANGRPTMTLSAPRSRASDPKAANKQLTGDDVKLFWRAQARDLEHAEVTGNAEMIVEPANPSASAERKRLTAPRFIAEFYETGNLARTVKALDGAQAVIEPLQPSTDKLARTLKANEMTANFVRGTQDIERVDAAGDARFNEGDRNGQASNMSYAAAERIVRLRGGEPTVWDSRARIKATEIDSDMMRRVSNARGQAHTTYYSQEQTGGAAPFAKVKSPVFITASAAEFQHDSGIGIYTGGARLWQDDNFIKADRITLRRDQKRMEGDGAVESVLYNVRQTGVGGGARSSIPVFAIARRMFYSEADRLLHYEGAVDIRQGTDRLTGEVANVFLKPDVNEVDKTVAERNVVVTRPGKRGAGDWAQYSTADETVTLTGNPARVEDEAQGMTESRRLTLYLRENRVTADNNGAPASSSSGRVRSIHKIRKQ